MFKHKKLFFIITKIKLLFVRILCAFIINKGKRREFRNKLYLKYKKQYLKNYLYALDGNLENVIVKNPKDLCNKIWICWLQGEKNMPDIVKVCIGSIKKYKPENMDIIILDEDSIKDYIKFPDYIILKREKDYIKSAQFSDLLRISLLSSYGGIWIDSTVLLTQKIPEDILNAEFFAFHSIEKGKHNNSWFLVSKSNNVLVNSVKNLMFEYWRVQNKMLDYFLYHLFFDVMVENNKKLEIEWNKVPLYWDYDCYDIGPLVFQKYDEEKFKELQKQFIHKLTYKYNKSKDIKGTFLEKILTMY